MSTKSTFSTNKIILLVVFISAAIIMSLFLLHLKHQPGKTTLASDTGTMFPVARDIKPFALVTKNRTAFTQKDFLGHWTLLIFGFTHCSEVCPTTLEMLDRAYRKLQPTYPNLQVVMISLDPDRDSLHALTNYTYSFNPAFIGASGKIQELHKLQSQLGIYSARDAANIKGEYQITHTSSILLINPKGQWAGVFKYGLNPQQFVQAFQESVAYLQT